MTPDEIKALADLPVIAILIFLLYRESAAKEKLLQELLLQAKQHSLDLVAMACHGFLDQEQPK